ncbi:MAG TPA: HAMP domain-containing protein, partial [Polyangiales bacterium]
MNDRLNQLKLSAKLMILIATSMVGLGVFAAMAFRTLDSVRVKGPIYDLIVADKDLTADVLPPPLYVIETYLTSRELSFAEEPAEQQTLIERLHRLRKDYEDRHAYWERALPEGKIRTLLLQDAHTPVVAIFRILDQIERLLMDGHREQARQLVLNDLRTQYGRHRAVIDQVVGLVVTQSKRTEQHADELLSQHITWLVVVAALVASAMIWLAMLIGKNLSSRIKLGIAVAEQVAEGDLATTIDVEGNDETGVLLTSLRKMTG